LRGKFPGIATQGLKDCFYYTDAVTDDARLVIRTLQEAVDDGGTAVNYARAEKLLLDSDGKVQGCSVRNSVSDECIDIKASAVVNATGAWADELRNQLTSEKRIRPLRGSHLVVAQERLPVSSAVTLMHPDDQRAMFVFPWEQRTVIGTTDLDHRAPLNQEASINREEVDYLLKAANELFPEAELQDEDIISTWSGVRPVIGSEKSKDPSKERRDHAVWRDGNLVTVSGGKLTTFRLIALDVLHALKSVIDIPEIDTQAPVFSRSFNKSAHYPQCPAAIFEHLHARYGNRVKSLLQNASEQDLTPIANTSITIAECRWILQHEAVTHLDDFMLRRTRLGQL
ncbi:MAG: FAD-dependent oxidoreductase, partial [Pseudomonadota bacterium]|nr:FAD-dependent oxidoreductase [Pseudomonadota bacterium]